jgi:hypothetical protein
VGGFDKPLCSYEDDDFSLRIFAPIHLPQHDFSGAQPHLVARRLCPHGQRTANLIQKLLHVVADDPSRSYYDGADVIAPRVANTWPEMDMGPMRYNIYKSANTREMH